MCGQFGVMTKFTSHSADDFLSDAFIASMLRGVDSSGIANIDIGRNEYVMHKLPVAGLHFVGDSVAKRLMSYGTGAKQLSMCHVRAATVGKVTLSNAHPFVIERDTFTLIGTHNGTLTGWQSKRNGSKFQVDSEWALSRIADDGISAFEDFNGAYAFVWWQGDDKEYLCMARNKERPMAVAFLKDGSMAYASEAGMLYWLLERNNMHLEDRIMLLEDGKLYKFPQGNPQAYEIEDLPAPKSLVYVSNHTGYNSSRNYNWSSTVDRVKELITKASSVTSEPTPLGPAATYFPMAYPPEIALARDYGWLDQIGEFSPVEVTTSGYTEGILDIGGIEFDAFIRGDYTDEYPMDEIWKVKVLGVREDGTQLEMVLSKPYATIDLYTAIANADSA